MDIDFTATWVKLLAHEKVALAHAIGSSVATLSQVAHGHLKTSDRYRRDLARALGSTPEHLVMPEPAKKQRKRMGGPGRPRATGAAA